MINQHKKISIGVGAPLSGSSSALGQEMKQAIELAVEEKNANGGISGSPIVAEIADDGSDPKKAEAIARSFCNNPEVLGVIGHYNSDATIAASAIYHEGTLALVSPIASNPVLTEQGFENVFRYTNRDDETANAIARYLFDTLGKRNAVIIESDSAYGKSMAENFVNSFTGSGGKIIRHQLIKDGESNVLELIGDFPKAFDLLFYGGSFKGAAILKAMRNAGLKQLFAAGDGCWDTLNFLRPAGNAANEGEGVLILSASHGTGHTEGSLLFAQRYARRYGPVINYALNAYDCANLLLESIALAAQLKNSVPDRSEIIAAVRNARFSGIANSKPVEWDQKGDNLSAITVLNVADSNYYREIAEIERSGREVVTG